MQKIVIHKKELQANIFHNKDPIGSVYFSTYEKIERKAIKFFLNGLLCGVYYPDIIKEVE